MFKLVINCEEFGTNHQQIETELKAQIRHEDTLRYIGQTAEHESSKTTRELQFISKAIKMNKEYLFYLGDITNIVEHLSKASIRNTKRALEIQHKKLPLNFWGRDLGQTISDIWGNLDYYAQLDAHHLRVAAEFHKFFYDGRIVESQMNKECRDVGTILKEMNHKVFDGTENEAKDLRSAHQNLLKRMNQLYTEIENLAVRSRQIQPIVLRVLAMKIPLVGMMLCDYRSENVQLLAGDMVTILGGLANMTSSVVDEQSPEKSGQERSRVNNVMRDQNTVNQKPQSLVRRTKDLVYWRAVSVNYHEECIVPSICVDLHTPSLDAREKALTLFDVLLVTWEDVIRESYANISDFICKLLFRLSEYQAIYTNDSIKYEEFVQKIRQFSGSSKRKWQTDPAAPISQLLGSVEQLYRQLPPVERPLEEESYCLTTEEMTTYIDLLETIEDHIGRSGVGQKQFDRFISSIREPHIPTFPAHKQLELISLIKKLTDLNPQQASQLLDQLKQSNPQLDRKYRYSHQSAVRCANIPTGSGDIDAAPDGE